MRSEGEAREATLKSALESLEFLRDYCAKNANTEVTFDHHGVGMILGQHLAFINSLVGTLHSITSFMLEDAQQLVAAEASLDEVLASQAPARGSEASPAGVSEVSAGRLAPDLAAPGSVEEARGLQAELRACLDRYLDDDDENEPDYLLASCIISFLDGFEKRERYNNEQQRHERLRVAADVHRDTMEAFMPAVFSDGVDRCTSWARHPWDERCHLRAPHPGHRHRRKSDPTFQWDDDGYVQTGSPSMDAPIHPADR